MSEYNPTPASESGADPIPSIGTLVAFESVARHRSFTRAAQELRTSQSAISRQIASLEKQLSSRLFERTRTGASLTSSGRSYRNAVVVGLGALRAGAADVAERDGQAVLEISIAASIEVSQLFVMPRYASLKTLLGRNVHVHILTCSHSGVAHLGSTPFADAIMTWDDAEVASLDRVVLADEALGPFCSPAFAAAHSDALSDPGGDWGGLTLLDFAAPDEPRPCWERYFGAADLPASGRHYDHYDNHLYALEAAVAGHGIVLGWRHLIQRYVGAGVLVPASRGYVETGRRFCIALTPKGHHRPLARVCLDFFDRAA